MNCRPGDLAVIVRAAADPSNLGRIVTVKRALSEGEPVCGFTWVRLGRGPSWLVAAPALQWCGDIVDERPVNDDFLRPIRDPGDDARDESLDWLQSPWLPVPSKEVA